jgi:hypothetical protein
VRTLIAIITFLVFSQAIAPLVFPTRCIGAFRTGNWTVDGPGGSYGYVRYIGEGFVHFGPLGEVSLSVLRRVALSAFAGVAAAALVFRPKEEGIRG